jgi:hypothetical protein
MSTFPSIRIEGGLLAPDLFDQLLAGELPGQKAADFGLDSKRNLTDEIAAVFADARALWGVFQNRLARLADDDVATSVTRDAWVIPFLGLLGYEPRYNQRAHEVDGLSFAISHRAAEADDAAPIHIVGARQELGRVPASGRPRLAPHSLVQEYLNRTEHLWGLVTNGVTLRLLRDCTFVRRQAYVEVDLAGILEEQRFNEFAVLYRLLHRTRLPKTLAEIDQCLLERYYSHSVEQGGRVREHLRDGVEDCLTGLANGFLRHPSNQDLRRRVSSAGDASDRLAPEDLYRQLLRLVYRFLFLLVSEDRGLISTDPVYREHYGIARLRRLLDQRASYTDHDDIWQSLRVLWRALGDEKLAATLGVAPLNGELFAHQDLDDCSISNRDLLTAFWRLAWYEERRGSPPRRVNYAALDVEELGSVYESLLEFHPHIGGGPGAPTFELLLAGKERRSTGSHYTPPQLVAPLIEHALEPVLNERLATAKTREQKERAVLGLKVCDMAAGSGHFLLAAARRLAKELARVRTDEDEPAPERVREATRDVISHAIYGVDKNPLAVELCRVALWLESNAEGKPLTFLDHRIRCGDSLVGVFDLGVLGDGVPDEAYKPVAGDDKAAARDAKKQNAIERESPLFHAPFAEQLASIGARLTQIDSLPEDTIEQVQAKAQAYGRAEIGDDFERLRLACDVWTSAFFQPFGEKPARHVPVTTQVLRSALANGRIPDPRLAGFLFETATARRFLHWQLSFPEVFASGGFNVVIGNPPFMGGKKISTSLGDKYRNLLVTALTPFPNTADLCAGFFRRATVALQPMGRLGLIATNTIAQGDTREAGLAPIVARGNALTYASRFVEWPGQATVEVNLIAILRGCTNETRILDGHEVEAISSRLEPEGEAEPARLEARRGQAFIGDFLRGIGFVLEPGEAAGLIAEDERNAQCIRPYLVGEDLNSDPAQQPSRFVISFEDWPLERAAQFPRLLGIVEERVRPEREKAKDKLGRETWWRFYMWRRGLRSAIAGLERVLVRAVVSDTHAVAFIKLGPVLGHKVVAFAFDDWFHFAVLQSAMHEAWVRRFTSTMRTDVNYSPSDCFETFPFPQGTPPGVVAEAERLGEAYHEHRRQVMLARQLGLTKTYNLFHDPGCTDADIVRLRELHAAMDRAILSCYGWADLEPSHGFHLNERGQTRNTISPTARRDLLRRLLALNLEIAAREATGTRA